MFFFFFFSMGCFGSFVLLHRACAFPRLLAEKLRDGMEAAEALKEQKGFAFVQRGEDVV